MIDSDYRGECFVALHNDSSEERTVRHGDRVAQLVLLPFLPMEFEEVDELPRPCAARVALAARDANAPQSTNAPSTASTCPVTNEALSEAR